MTTAPIKLLMSLSLLQSTLVFAGPSRLIASQPVPAATTSVKSEPTLPMPTGPAQEVQAVSNLAALFPEKKIKVSDFLKKIEGKIPANYLKEVQKRLKPGLKESFEYEVLAPNKFVLRTGGNETIFELVSMADNQMKVNNRLVTINMAGKPQHIIEDFQKLFPRDEAKGASHPLLMLFLPEAQAFPWLIVGGIAAAVGLVLWNNSNCQNYKNLEQQCAFARANEYLNPGIIQGLLINIQTTRNKMLNLSIGCSSAKSNVAACELEMMQRVSGGGTTNTPGTLCTNPAGCSTTGQQ